MPRLYGFDDASRRRLRDDEVDPLRQMVSRALSNQSNQDVAVWANGEGYRGTLGGEWKDASVGRLFRNPAIAGLRYDDDGELVDAGHPGAITREEFEALLEREKARSTKDAEPAYDYLLTGGAAPAASAHRILGRPYQCGHARIPLSPEGQEGDRRLWRGPD
ncbi:hypothetical protein F3K40_08645 [Streptomyces sp. LBUM 1478]|nr:hypothetical protein [Streptomyces sp. LBUM 1478]